MPRCSADAVQWKGRRAYRLSNGHVEITALLGGGHIADFRLCGSPINALWEAPWPTIEPQMFSPEHAALYGDGPVGRFLCRYTGHALVIGYFGMPSSAQSAQSLPLHGEAASREWKIASVASDDHSATLVMEVTLPVCGLHFRREISLTTGAFTACIRETVSNPTDALLAFQWVEHAAFGEPLLTNGESTIYLSGNRGITWPSGYEGHELLAGNTEFQWPYAPAADGTSIDISQPFVKDGTGFVAAVLADSNREDAFVAVHNRTHHLVAGYSFDRELFPWIALWEENRAREYAPWNKRTRVRGVEFGTSPMPLGLDHARTMGRLFETPVLVSLPAKAEREVRYDLFLHPVPPQLTQIKDIQSSGNTLAVQGDGGKTITFARSEPSH